MDENIRSIISPDETISFRVIKPLDISLHCISLRTFTERSDHDARSPAPCIATSINWPECTRIKKRVNRKIAVFAGKMQVFSEINRFSRGVVLAPGEGKGMKNSTRFRRWTWRRGASRGQS